MFTIRSATPADTEQLKQLALDNGMFTADEIGIFDEMLDGFFDGTMEGHQWLVATLVAAPDQVAAGAYFAPEPFSDRMWNLYFIATAPDQHGTGAGSALIDAVEQQLRAASTEIARTLIVETSSEGDYAVARDFYGNRGFVEEATVREFYGPGDHKVTFWKLLAE